MLICVTVTYGDRFDLLDRVIDRALDEGADAVVVVDNASAESSRVRLRDRADASGGRVRTCRLERNEGSAAGFGRGIAEALRIPGVEFVWLLDDDNLPVPGALDRLRKAHAYLSGLGDREVALACVRRRRDDESIPFDGRIKRHRTNAFLGFTLRRAAADRRRRGASHRGAVNYPFVRAEQTAYGGLFVPASVLGRVGLPREDFRLYADDHEFTRRFAAAGADIYVCAGAEVDDIDDAGLPNGAVHPFFQPRVTEEKVYLQVRNHVALGRPHVRNRLVYFANMAVLTTILVRNGLRVPRLLLPRLRQVLRGIRDGHRMAADEASRIGRTVPTSGRTDPAGRSD